MLCLGLTPDGVSPGCLGWGSQLRVPGLWHRQLSGIGFFLYLHSYPILLGLGLYGLGHALYRPFF